MGRLAEYDYRGLGRLLRARLESDGRGWRVCAAEIGVTAADLSRICNGQPVSAPKVIAVCDWMKLSFRAFYEAPDVHSASRAEVAPAGRATGRDGRSALPSEAGQAREAEEMFHGNSTETEEATHAG